MSKEELLKKLSDYVYEMEDLDIPEVAKEYLDAGHSAHDGVHQGLIKGMERAGDSFADEEYFVSDLLFASDAMYAALEIFEPALTGDQATEKLGTCIIGNVEGDTHDIGKNLVKTMLDAAGFNMIDLGKDVPVQEFIDQAETHQADVICISTLMTTTMPVMREVLEELSAQGVRDKYKVAIGGGPVTEKFAEEIGADGYSENASEAVNLIKRLLAIPNE